MAPPHILNWLKQAAANYVYQDQTTAAIAAALDRYPSLKIKTEQYTFDDGRTLLLLCLHGTLPITYSSARYNVPVAVWLPLDSPRSPPMVYVVPTSGMLVRKGKGVELDGRVSEEEWEYLRGWRRKWEAHSILPLLQSLVDAFSQYPPVYAKPTPTASTPSASPVPARAQSSPSTSQVQPQPSTKISHSHNGSEHLPKYTHPASSSAQPPPPPPPPPPPLPPIPGQSPLPSLSHGRQSSIGPPRDFPRADSQGSLGHPPVWQQPGVPSRSSTYSPGYGPPSPLYRQQQQQQQQQQQYVQQSQPSSPLRTQPQYQRPPPPSSTPPQPQGPPMHPAYQHQHYQQAYHAQRSSAMPPQHTGPPPPAQSPQRIAQSPSAAPARPTSQPPPPRQPIIDLLSADDEPALTAGPSSAQTPALPPPPPPPNPETVLLHSTLHATLSSSLGSTLAGLTTRRAQLAQIKDDLASAQPAIEDEMARLRAVRDVCRGVGERFGSVVSAGDERLAWLEARGEVGVDEVVCSTTIVYNQLVDLVAEDAAISDTIYQLNRALNAERIDLERFLKMTRILARDQFRCRALVEKVLKG